MLSLVFTALFSISAFALTDGDWEFQLLDDEVTITKYNGTSSNVVIPDKIFGAPVTKVQKNTFRNNRVVKITFPSSVKKIEPIINSSDDSLQEVILPDGIEEIAKDAFHDCYALKSISLPSTIMKIGGGYYEGAFEGGKSLVELNFPANLSEIGNYAFADSGLKHVDLSSTQLNRISSSSFKDCDDLESIKLNNGIKYIDSSAFWQCHSLNIVIIPDTLLGIGDWSFYECSSLEFIILPTSLKSIGRFSFAKCASLKEIVIPYGATTIDDGTFQECPSLQSIYIPDTVNKITMGLNGSNNAIVYCIQNSVTADYCKKNSISYLTDESVNSLITVYYNGTRISFHEYDQNPELINDRTLVPLRAIFEAMNANVQWDQATQTVTSTRDGVTIKLTIGDDKIYKNGQAITTVVPAQIINDRTMIPVRVIAEAFGADVEWNGSGRAVLINE